MSTLTALNPLLAPASAIWPALLRSGHDFVGVGNFMTLSSCNCHCSYGNKGGETLPSCGKKKKEERTASPMQVEISSYSLKEHYEFSTWQTNPHANANGGHWYVWRSGTSCAAVVIVKSPELHSLKKKMWHSNLSENVQYFKTSVPLMETECCLGDLKFGIALFIFFMRGD